MVAVVMPIVKSMHHADRFRAGLLIGIAVAANIGGMATIIGSPPNAIAVGALRNIIEIDFLRWSLAAAPPAAMLLLIAWAYLALRYGSWAMSIDLKPLQQAAEGSKLPRWQIGTVMLLFTITILLWLTQALHGIPVTVVSFLPICVFTAVGILNSDDVCQLRWDVLLLIAGGLSLGVAVTDTGLASWMVSQLPLESLGVLGLALTLAFATTIVSNFMSNTAAANILVPIAMVASTGSEAQVVIPLAIGASAAMALPISTPPNAIIFSSKEVRTPQLMECGLLIGLLAPVVSTFWCNWVMQYLY
jgi:sodium-dependent dicarboxylate transporter 2/3/5